MSDTLARFQTDFLERLYTDPSASEALGWRVYRNTVLKGCIDALQANYPTVTRLVGETWLRAAAAVYVRGRPPTHACLFDYGADFDDFLAGFAPARELPYLPAVARLDRFWSEAHMAADTPVAAPTSIAGLTPEPLSRLVLMPHPAARWRWFDGVPAYTLWRANRDQSALPETLDWHGEGALLTRPAGEVRSIPLARAGVHLLDACTTGRPLMTAGAEVLMARPDTDLSALLAALLKAGAFARPDFRPAPQ